MRKRRTVRIGNVNENWHLVCWCARTSPISNFRSRKCEMWPYFANYIDIKWNDGWQVAAAMAAADKRKSNRDYSHSNHKLMRHQSYKCIIYQQLKFRFVNERSEKNGFYFKYCGISWKKSVQSNSGMLQTPLLTRKVQIKTARKKLRDWFLF